MLEVDDILPSSLTPLVLAPRVPEPVCEMKTPGLFTMAQNSPKPQTVDTPNYARVNPLPSPATSSSSSGELHLYTDSDTSPPTRQLTITLARTPHPGNVHGQQSKKSTGFDLRRYRLHNRLLDTQQALPKAHSPRPLAEGQTPSPQHTAFHIGHKDLILASTSSQILSESIQSRAYMC